MRWVSTNHFWNFAKLSIALNRFVVRAPVVSFFGDASLDMLLSDDRLPVMLQGTESQIVCDMAYIADLGLRPFGFEVRCRRRGVDICPSYPRAVRCGKKLFLATELLATRRSSRPFFNAPSLSICCRGRFISSVASSIRFKNSCKVFTCFAI